jgi:hypothetical protein
VERTEVGGIGRWNRSRAAGVPLEVDAGGRRRCWRRGVGGGAGGSRAVLARPGGEDGGGQQC